VALAIPGLGLAEQDVNTNLNPYIAPADYGAQCAALLDDGDCGDLVSSLPVAGEAFVWVVASREGGFPQGVGGMQFGIEYSGLTVVGWTLCTGGSEISQAGWPDSGTGNAVTWSGGCYSSPGTRARIGYISILDGSQGSFSVTGDPRLNPVGVEWADCDAVVWQLCVENLGGIADLSAVGDVPPNCGDHCPIIPVEDHSWGQIKNLYR
jgi:hypothetical protein